MTIGRFRFKGWPNGFGRAVSEGRQSPPAPVTAGRAGSTGGEGGHRLLAVNVLAGGALNVLKIAVQLVTLPLMAHFLGPTEFGLYALAMPTVSFFIILADGGLAVSLARESRDATLVWSTAFWLVLLVGVVLAGIVTAWGFALAALTDEPRVRPLMALLSLTLLMFAASALPTANLTRQRRMPVLAAADLVGTFVGAALGVWLAATGFGAMSLAAQFVSAGVIYAGVLNAVAFVRPTFQFRISAVVGHLSLGSALLSVKLADLFGRMFENVLFSRAFGAGGLGAYAFANQAPRFICEAAGGPVWGALYAHAISEDPHQVEKAHVNMERLLASIVFPVAALLSATSPEILGAILGPKWAQASTTLGILLPFYALNAVANLSGAILLARNRGWLLLRISLFLSIGRVVVVALGPWLASVAVVCGVGAVMAVCSLWMMAAPGRRTASSLVRGLGPPVASSAIAGALCHALAHVWGDNANLVWIACCWALAGAVYVLALAAMQPQTVRADWAALRGFTRGVGSRGFPKAARGVVPETQTLQDG